MTKILIVEVGQKCTFHVEMFSFYFTKKFTVIMITLKVIQSNKTYVYVFKLMSFVNS